MYDLKCQTIKHQTSSAFSRAMTIGAMFLLVFSQQLVISVPVLFYSLGKKEKVSLSSSSFSHSSVFPSSVLITDLFKMRQNR